MAIVLPVALGVGGIYAFISLARAGDAPSAPKPTTQSTPCGVFHQTRQTIWSRTVPAVALPPVTLSLTAPEKKSASQTPPSRRVGGRAYVIHRMRVTAYCPCCDCCGPRACGVTANGTRIWNTDGYFVAADPAIPFGTRLSVPGYAMGRPVPVLDRGRAVTTDCVDVYFADHRTAKRWGVRWLEVRIYLGRL